MVKGISNEVPSVYSDASCGPAAGNGSQRAAAAVGASLNARTRTQHFPRCAVARIVQAEQSSASEPKLRPKFWQDRAPQSCQINSSIAVALRPQCLPVGCCGRSIPAAPARVGGRHTDCLWSVGATLAAAARRVTFETPPANRARLPSYASSAVSMRPADVIHISDRLKPYR